MTILVTGSRWWTDYRAILRMLGSFPHDTQLIHGAARGADQYAANVARYLEWSRVPIPFPADWGRYGKAAGARRNREMLDQKPDLVLAFHNDLTRPKCGTRDCIDEARRRGIPVLHWSSGPEEPRP